MLTALRQDRAEATASRAAARRRRSLNEGATEALGLFIGCLALYVFFWGFMQPLVNTWLGWGLLGMAALGALGSILLDMQAGRSLFSSVMLVMIVGVLVIGLVGGIWWYLHEYLPTHGGLLGNFGRHTPTPVP